jgi:type III secretion protein N (ATPase)
MAIDRERTRDLVRDADLVGVQGRVQAVVGLGIQGVVPGVRLGELLEIERRTGGPLPCEVVGFRDNVAVLMPLGSTESIGLDDAIRVTGKRLSITFGESLLGRVLDGLGKPVDGGPELDGKLWEVMRPPPEPMTRPRVERALPLGIRSLDGFVTVGEGQRIGIFAGSGAGKSMLLGQIARQAEADVFVVCLVGERGRELRDFVEDALGPEGRGRGVVVCATSDTPALVRMKSAYVATAIAEGFRDQGKRVVLLMDSVTRFARAAREVGLAAGEPPTRRGFPPSAFAALPPLVERVGTSPTGSITAFYTVLVEGDDLDEPISDEVRGILDGHIVLSRELGSRGRWPAVDVLSSLSRLMERVAEPDHRRAAGKVRGHLAVYESKRDLVTLGAYRRGSDAALDAALSRMARIDEFLGQRPNQKSDFDETVRRLQALV